MNKKKQGYLATCILLFCFFLSACGTPVEKVDLKDGGLLSDQAVCKAPCLLGITPGVTRESEVWKILNSYELSNACDGWDHTDESGGRGIQCNWKNQVIAIGLQSQDDPILSIGFTPSEKITMSQIIEKYGEPSGFVILDEGLPEHVEVGMAVFYDEISTRLDFRIQDGWVYDIGPESPIVSVSYLSPQEYAEYMNIIKDSLREWMGYGKYK